MITSTRTGRDVIREMVRLSWDSGDLKHSSISPLFDLCEAMTFLGFDVPAQLGYSQGWSGEPDSEMAVELISAWEEESITAEDMTYWSLVLDQYLDRFVRGTDRDY